MEAKSKDVAKCLMEIAALKQELAQKGYSTNSSGLITKNGKYVPLGSKGSLDPDYQLTRELIQREFALDHEQADTLVESRKLRSTLIDWQNALNKAWVKGMRVCDTGDRDVSHACIGPQKIQCLTRVRVIQEQLMSDLKTHSPRGCVIVTQATIDAQGSVHFEFVPTGPPTYDPGGAQMGIGE